MPGQNDLDINFEPASLIANLQKFNKARAEMEAGVVGAGERMNKAWESLSRGLVSATDRQEQAQRRLVKSILATNDAYGKSPLEREQAKMQRIIKSLGDNRSAVDAVTKSYENLFAKMRQNEKTMGGSLDAGGVRMLRGLRDLFEGRTAYGEVQIGRGLGELSGLPLILGATAAAFAGVELAGAKAAVSVGNYAEKVHDLSAVTGLSTTEIQQFQAAAKITGDDISVLERMTRGLSRAIEDEGAQGDKARQILVRMGVDVRGLREGTVSSIDLFKQVSSALEAQPNLWQRNSDAIKLFQRAGIQSIPMIIELNDSLKRTQGIHFLEQDQISKFDEIHKQLSVVGTEWEQFMLRVKASLAGPFLLTLKVITAGLDALEGQSQTGFGRQFHIENGRLVPGRAPQPTRPGFAAVESVAENFRADQAVRSYLNLRTPEDRLREAEQVRSALGVARLGVSSAKEIEAMRAADAVVEQRKKEVEIANQQKSVLEELRKAEIKAGEGTLYRLKTDQQLIDFMAKPSVTPAQAAQMQTILAPARLREVTEDLRKAGLTVNPDGTISRAPAEYGAGLKAEDLRESQARNAANRQRNLVNILTKQQEDDLREQANAISETLSTARKTGTTLAESRVRIGQALAPDTVQNRIAAERQLLAIKMQSAEEEYRDAASKVSDLYGDKETRELKYKELRMKADSEVAEAQAKFDEQRAQEQRRQLDEIKSKSESLYHTLFTNPSAFGKSLGTTVRDAALKPVESRLGDLTAQLLYPIIGTAGPLGGGGGIMSVKPVNGAVPVIIMGGGSGGSSTTIFSGGGGFGGGGGAASLPMSIGMNPLLFPGLGDLVGGPGGTSGFAGPVTSLGYGGGYGGGAVSSGGGLASGIGGIFNRVFGGGGTAGGGGGGLPGFGGLGNLFGKGGLPGFFGQGPNAPVNAAGYSGLLASPAAGIGGMALASQSLIGSWAGTPMGILGGAAGGALIGFQYGGPLGAAIGAAAGFGIGLGEFLAGVEPKWKEAERLIKQQYHISINRQMADQVVNIAKQSYGGTISIAVRSPEVRQMLGLYAAGTGQAGAFPQSATTPHGGGLVESGGALFQSPTYLYGNSYSYQSNLPVYGGSPTGTLSNPGGPTYMSFNVQGDSVSRFLDGGVFSPSAVNDKLSAAQLASSGRTQAAMNYLEPGSVVA